MSESDCFYIQSGYTGKEVSALMWSLDRTRLRYSAVHDYDKSWPVVGSVEFVEAMMRRTFRPNYFPEFLQEYFCRDIWFEDELPLPLVFVKPADRHKRFDGKIISAALGDREIGPFVCSGLVTFKDEWRYYVANGEILAAHWYQGPEEEIEPYPLTIDWPEWFCGAVDFGRLSTGEIALVENHLPYACGWYGSASEGEIYAEWLSKGHKYLCTL